MKKRYKFNFTLAEILVAMAVFSVLLVIIMQFFSGARTLWTANEKRAAMYTDASVALDLMANLLQGTYCTTGPVAGSTPVQMENKTVFELVSNSGKDKLYFVTNSPMELAGGGSVRYLSFQRGTDPAAVAGAADNVLYLRIFGDKNYLLPNGQPLLANCFYEFVTPDSWPAGWSGPTALSTLADAREVVKYALDNIPLSNTNACKPVLRNVTGLSFKLLGGDGKETADKTTPPAGIEISLSLMPDETVIKTWQDMANGTEKDDFKLKNEVVFHRTVWLTDRAYVRN